MDLESWLLRGGISVDSAVSHLLRFSCVSDFLMLRFFKPFFRSFAFRSATSIIRRCPQGVGEFLQPCSRFWWCHGVVRRGFALLSAGFHGLSSAGSFAGIPRLAAQIVAPRPPQLAAPPERLVGVCAASSCAAAQRTFCTPSISSFLYLVAVGAKRTSGCTVAAPIFVTQVHLKQVKKHLRL